MSNPVIAILKCYGLNVTREEYIELATLGGTDLDCESEAEMEAALEEERESVRELERMFAL